MAKVDLRSNRPKLERLPDNRLRATFSLDVREWVGRTKAEVLAEVWIAYGTEATGDFTGLRLINQYLDGLTPNKNGSIPLIRVYEEIPATTEVLVGEASTTRLDDGRTAKVYESLQFASATATPGTVGTSTAPGDTASYLITEEAPIDGVLRRIKRAYVAAGTLSQVDQTKNAGKLLIRTVVAIKTEPSTPSGYTLVTQDKKSPNGITVYTYTFAKGLGRVSTDITYKQNGKLKITTIRYLDTDDGSTPSGTLVNDDSQTQEGCTLYTKGYAEIVGDGIVSSDIETKHNGKLRLYRIVRLGTAPSAPTASLTPTAGTVVATATDTRQEDGFTLYDYRWTEGYGRISLEVDTKEAGALVLSTVRYFVTDDGATPDGNIIRADTAKQDGVDLTTKVYAAGSGEISRETRDHLDGRITYTTIRALGAYVSATGEFETTVEDADGYSIYISRGIVVNDATFPDIVETREGTALTITTMRKIDVAPTMSGALIESHSDPREGYTLYTAKYAVGSGQVSSDAETRLSGMLLRTTIRHLTATSVGTQPTTDPFTTGGTVTGETLADQEGYCLWTIVWTKAITTSHVTDTKETKNGGKLIIYRRSKLGAAPTAPDATISGTVTEIDYDQKLEDGYTLHSKTWAEGHGVIQKRYQQRPGGLRLETWVSIGAAYDGTYMLPGGVLMAKDYEETEGAQIWTVTAMQLAAGGADPTSGTALTNTTKYDFTYPGRAKAISTTVVLGATTFTIYDVYQSPPIKLPIDATVKITYQASGTLGALDNAIWAPDTWATIYATFVGWSSHAQAIITSLPGYRSISETALTFNGGSVYAGGYLQTCLGNRVYAYGSGTPYSMAVKGGPAAPDGNTYTLHAELDPEPAFVAYDGTKYYRKTQIYATIPAQTALPV